MSAPLGARCCAVCGTTVGSGLGNSSVTLWRLGKPVRFYTCGTDCFKAARKLAIEGKDWIKFRSASLSEAQRRPSPPPRAKYSLVDKDHGIFEVRQDGAMKSQHASRAEAEGEMRRLRRADRRKARKKPA